MLERLNASALGLYWTFRPVDTHGQSVEQSYRFDKFMPSLTLGPQWHRLLLGFVQEAAMTSGTPCENDRRLIDLIL